MMETKMAFAVAPMVASVTPEPGYTCHCGRRFRQKAPYARHIDIAHSSCASIKCVVCGKTFGTHNTLTMHMSVHDVKQQPFVRLQHVTDIKKTVTSVVIAGGMSNSGDSSRSNNSCVDGGVPAKTAVVGAINGTATPAEKQAIIEERSDCVVTSDAGVDVEDDSAVRKSVRLRGKVPAWKTMLEEAHLLDGSDADALPYRKRECRIAFGEEDEHKTVVDERDKNCSNAMEMSSVLRTAGIAVVVPTVRTTPTPAKRSRSGKRSADAAFVCPVCAKEFTSDKYLTMHRALHEVVNPAENLMSDVYRQPDSSEAPLSSPRQRSPGGVIGGVANGSGIGGAVNGCSGGGANTSWTCKICRKTFAQNSNFKNHMRTHSDERPFVCSICSIGFKERYHLKKHQLFKHSTELREACRVCGKRFKDSTAVRAHERIHSDVRPYVCRRCGKAFKTSECLWHHENRSKTCGVALDQHVQRIRQQLQQQQQQQQHQPQPQRQQVQQQGLVQQQESSCVKAESYVKAELPRVQSDTAAAPIQRPRVPMIISVPAAASPQVPRTGKPAVFLIIKKEPPAQQTELQQACAFLQTVSSEQVLEPKTESITTAAVNAARFSCDLCVKAFTTSTAYERHMLKHSEERPYRCIACDAGFKLKVHLKKHHLYRHTDEYPCGCSICGKRFKDSSAVRLHERIHSTDRPFKCGCGKTFKTRENLWGHQHRIQCDSLSGNGSRADAAYACCMPGATASPVRTSEDDDSPSESQVVAAAQGQGNVSVHASVNNNRVIAQAYCAEKRVTAQAMIGHNGEVTAHVTISPNRSDLHASNGYGDGAPLVNGDGAAGSEQSLPSFATFAPTTTIPTGMGSQANHRATTSIAQQCPTIQSFLLRGPDYSERTKLPGIQQIFQNHQPPANPNPNPPPPYNGYTRPTQPSRNVVVLPNAASDDLYTSVHERLAMSAMPMFDKLRCDGYSTDLGAANDPCLTECVIGLGASNGGRSGIPVIYWDDEAERKSLMTSPWQKDTDSLFHDISDSGFTHL